PSSAARSSRSVATSPTTARSPTAATTTPPPRRRTASAPPSAEGVLLGSASHFLVELLAPAYGLRSLRCGFAARPVAVGPAKPARPRTRGLRRSLCPPDPPPAEALLVGGEGDDGDDAGGGAQRLDDVGGHEHVGGEHLHGG